VASVSKATFISFTRLSSLLSFGEFHIVLCWKKIFISSRYEPTYNFCDFSVCLNFDPLTAGNVVCSWGRGEDGQLGHGDTDDQLLPTKLSAFDGQDIASVTCGADFTVARSESGRDVYSWGWSALYLNYTANITTMPLSVISKNVQFIIS
jgi:hypothetical protein